MGIGEKESDAGFGGVRVNGREVPNGEGMPSSPRSSGGTGKGFLIGPGATRLLWKKQSGRDIPAGSESDTHDGGRVRAGRVGRGVFFLAATAASARAGLRERRRGGERDGECDNEHC